MNDRVNILLVEDNELVRRLTADMLRASGFKVQSAESGEHAIECLDAADAPYNALVTDIDLGGNLTGWQVAEHARELSPTIPVIYITGDSAGQWPARGLPNSVLLVKPFEPAKLLTAVSQLLSAMPRSR